MSQVRHPSLLSRVLLNENENKTTQLEGQRFGMPGYDMLIPHRSFESSQTADLCGWNP